MVSFVYDTSRFTIAYTSSDTDFFQVIHAWANSPEDDALFRANDLLTKIKKLRKSGARPDLVPDNVSYTSIISALAKASSKNKSTSKESARLLDEIMNDIQNDMINTNLDSGVYNSLIHAKVQSGEVGAAEKAEAVLMSLIHNDAPMAVRPVSNHCRLPYTHIILIAKECSYNCFADGSIHRIQLLSIP